MLLLNIIKRVASLPTSSIKSSNLLAQVNCLSKNLIENFKEDSIIIGILNPHKNKETLNNLVQKKVNPFSLELLPRITRAQSMDVLSSQANLAGYRAVIDSIYEFGGIPFPLFHNIQSVNELSDKYDTILDERGMNLSLGQRQLISFARVLLADPEILILDEATANVDTFTEIKIQKALNTLLNNRTSIVIAHRLSTIRNADRIIVMDQGKILASGSHEELMNSSEFYQNLYNLNFTE